MSYWDDFERPTDWWRNSGMSIDPNDSIVATTVTISKKEYAELCMAQTILARLESAGVDNWDFYDDALEGLFTEEDEDD